MNFCLKTLVTKSGLSSAFYSPSNYFYISSHLGLHVNVINKSGLPYSPTYANASNLFWFIYLGPPRYDEGKIYFLPISLDLISLLRDASLIEL